MKKTLLFLLISVNCLFTFCTEEKTIVAPEQNPDLTTQLQEMLSEEYETYLSQYPDYAGGIAFQVVSQKGDYFIQKGFGEELTNQIHFRAASITKTFTSAGILLLYQKSKLNIAAKITDIIPGTNEPYIPATEDYNISYKDEITIWQLLTHRAGVFDVTNDAIPVGVAANVPYKGEIYPDYVMSSDPNHTFSFDELIGVVATCKLSYFQPGTAYHYSNQGYSLLGKIIERVSGKSYKQFMMDNFVTPLGLASTNFPDTGDDTIIPVPLVPGYVQLENQILDVTQSNMSANIAEGNLLTTPGDLSKFIRLLLNGEAGVNLSLINNVMMDCKPTSDIGAGGYGAGLVYWNNLGYGHNGAHEGFLSFMVYDPAIDFTVVMFTNCWNVIEMESSLYMQIRYLQEYCRKVKSIIVDN